MGCLGKKGSLYIAHLLPLSSRPSTTEASLLPAFKRRIFFPPRPDTARQTPTHLCILPTRIRAHLRVCSSTARSASLKLCEPIQPSLRNPTQVFSYPAYRRRVQDNRPTRETPPSHERCTRHSIQHDPLSKISAYDRDLTLQ